MLYENSISTSFIAVQDLQCFSDVILSAGPLLKAYYTYLEVIQTITEKNIFKHVKDILYWVLHFFLFKPVTCRYHLLVLKVANQLKLFF